MFKVKVLSVAATVAAALFLVTVPAQAQGTLYQTYANGYAVYCNDATNRYGGDFRVDTFACYSPTAITTINDHLYRYQPRPHNNGRMYWYDLGPITWTCTAFSGPYITMPNGRSLQKTNYSCHA